MMRWIIGYAELLMTIFTCAAVLGALALVAISPIYIVYRIWRLLEDD